MILSRRMAGQRMNEAARTLIPVTILTGFLGSGKTTLLRRLLMRPELAECAVLINEYGEVGIDHHLVRDVHADTIVLPNGCVCCSVQSDLVNALRELLFGRGRGGIPRYPRVFIETTGLADPAPVVHGLISDPFVVQHYRLDGIVAVVDAVFGMRQLDAHRECVKQVAVADRIVLSKTDVAEAVWKNALRGRLRAINPAATVVEATHGEIEPAAILDTGFSGATKERTHAVRWLAAEQYKPVQVMRPLTGGRPEPIHDDRVRSFVVRLNKPFPSGVLLAAIAALCATFGKNILRIKGLLAFEGEPAPMVLHAVQHVIYPLIRLGEWPDGRHGSVLVFIVCELEPVQIHNALSRALGPDALSVPETTPAEQFMEN